MPCCAVLLILFIGPRIAMIAMAMFSDYLGRAFGDTLLLPLLGWLFLPWTTLAYAWAMNTRGEIAGLQMVVVIVAAMIDLGLIGGGAAKRRVRD
ncbi:MAG: hypothetical protein KDC27_12655 [Acidobacteria bacterium]|nr:hypothetical protein [Acidobacteriota bacterium]